MSILSILLALAVAWFLLKPLLAAGEPDVIDGSGALSQSLTDQKNRCLQVLKDLEFDYRTNRVSEKDYESTRKRLMNEIGRIMKRLEPRSAEG